MADLFINELQERPDTREVFIKEDAGNKLAEDAYSDMAAPGRAPFTMSVNEGGRLSRPWEDREEKNKPGDDMSADFKPPTATTLAFPEGGMHAKPGTEDKPHEPLSLMFPEAGQMQKPHEAVTLAYPEAGQIQKPHEPMTLMYPEGGSISKPGEPSIELFKSGEEDENGKSESKLRPTEKYGECGTSKKVILTDI